MTPWPRFHPSLAGAKMRSLLSRLLICALLLIAIDISAAAAAPCSLSQSNPSVTVCTPTPNALVQSQVNVIAGSTDSNSVTAMQIYVDNKLVYQVNASTVNTFVSLPVGYHLITVQGWDSTHARSKAMFRWRCSRLAL
jgi:hypothetical protein